MHWDPSMIKALKELEAKLSSDLEAVRRILALAAPDQSSVHEILSSLTSQDQPSENPISSKDQPTQIPHENPLKVAGLVRQCVTELDGSFGIGDVKSRIKMHSQRTYGDVAIRQQLKKMELEGELVITFQGLGRAGSQYAKTSRFQPSPLF